MLVTSSLKNVNLSSGVILVNMPNNNLPVVNLNFVHGWTGAGFNHSWNPFLQR